MIKPNSAKAFLVLRLGLAFVFAWFACAQFHNPTEWTSYLPSWIGSLPISAIAFVKINALFEIVGAALLLVGAWTRPVALLLALHLFGIVASIGLNSVGIRDIGLAVAALTLAIGGAGMMSIDTETTDNTLESHA